MKYAEVNATKYQAADLRIIFSNNKLVEKIESIKRDVDTGIHL